MKINRLFLILLLSTLIMIELPADTTGKPDSTILLNCAYSNDFQLQLMALDSLMAKFKKENFIEDDLIQIPIDLAQESIFSQDNMEVQIKAISILGEIGGQKALNALSNILISSNDSIILMEAVKSSTSIVADDYRYFISALGSVMKKQHSLFKDNKFAFASLTSIDKITLKTGNILTSEILGIMMVYSEGVYNQEVKEYSRNLLTDILTER